MRVSITFTAGPARGRSFSFDEPDCFLFGRGADAKVSLPNDPYVSRQHFLLEIAPPNCKITDLNSKGGFHVNGVRYGGRTPLVSGTKQAPNGAKDTFLKDGDEIAVGDSRAIIAIEVDALCANCGLAIPNEAREKLQVAGGGFFCAECRAKQAAKAAPAAPPKERPLHCTRCKKDVAAEAGLRGQAKDAQYVCKDCRAKEKANPEALLDDVLGLAAAAPLVPGAPAISGYHIEEELGRGGMGVVYKATQKRTGRKVAIKTMLPNVATTERAVRVFQREVEITRQLKHPNIVELIEHGQARGTFFFVLEFVDGMDLEKFVASKGGKLELAESVSLMMGILDGLAYAHRAKLKMAMTGSEPTPFTGGVHRDLKPANILLARGGVWTPKVADFGLAKSFESAGMTDITAPGGVWGTPAYWPREQITHYRYLAPPTDVFSIAAVFYEMLTGACARDGITELFTDCARRDCQPSLANIMCVIIEHPIAPLRSRNHSIPKRVADVIDRALREEAVSANEHEMRAALAKLRYPDAGEFRDALRKALKQEGISL